MALKGTSGAGKGKAGRTSRPTGGSSRKLAGSSSGNAPKFTGTAGSSAKSSSPAKSFSGKQPAKPVFSSGGGGRGNRTLWLVLGALVLLALCCICSLVIAWTYGDSAADLLRQLQFQ